jgi:hypothetical protein
MTRHELEDERSFLLRSLEDLDAEHEAGDLSDEDHAVLRDGYMARAAEVLKSLDDGPQSARSAVGTTSRQGRHKDAAARRHDTGGRRRRPRRPLVVGVVVIVIGVTVWAVASHVGPRLPGESLTGSVALSSSQQLMRTLAQAETLESEGDDVEAVKLYASVLRQDPTQEQALAEVGWLEFEAGAEARKATLLSLGERDEEEAESVDPGDYAPHLYLGSMLLAQDDATGAVDQYRLFLKDGPPEAKVKASSSFIVQAFTDAHLTPPALAVGGSAGG